MMDRIVGFALKNPTIVILSALLLAGAGVFAYWQLDIEAYPNPVPPMVEVITQPDGWSAEEVERQVTIPLEIGLAGMPGLERVGSISLFGLSDVKCYFKWGTNYEAARQEVINRLQFIKMPNNLIPTLSPWNAIGEIYRYVISGKGYTLEQLKTAQDWILEPQFRQVPGVVDVTGFGGEIKQYQIDIDPIKLRSKRINLNQVTTALSNANVNVGGQRLTIGEQSFTVRGTGLIKDLQDIERIVLTNPKDIPVTIRDVAEVHIGAAPRLGRVSQDHHQDIVEGIILMRYGASTLKTLDGVHQRIEYIRKNNLLPPGMDIVPYYDRGDLVHLTTHTVMENLLMGIFFVVLVLVLFLGHLRPSFIAAINIPLALLVAFCGMVLTGTPANLISLGAVDFGIVIDSTVIMVENISRRLRGSHHTEIKERILTAAREVAGPMGFSTLIIAVAFLPLFTLQGVEGVIFAPMARTYAFAILAAICFAITLTPVLASRALHTHVEEEKPNFTMRTMDRFYIPIFDFALRRPKITAASVLIPMFVGLGLFFVLGREFMPKLEEGNLWIRATLPISISLEQSTQYTNKMREILLRHPEVESVVSQTGRPDDGTDVTGFFDIEIYVPLKPESTWARGVSKESLTASLSKEFENNLPGVAFNFSQMISDNVEEALAGVKGENTAKVVGPSLQINEAKASEIYKILSNVPGIEDLGTYRSSGQPSLRITPNRILCAQYGLNTGDVEAVIQAAVGGQAITQVYEAERHFDLVVRFKKAFRKDIDAIRNILVATPSGSFVPLSQLADFIEEDSPSLIYREDGHRYTPVKFSVRGRDLAGTVEQAQAEVAKHLTLPYDTHVEWSGQLNSLKDATTRLQFIVPLTLLLIAFLVRAAVKNWIDLIIVFIAIPFACAGGVFSLLVTGLNFSISAAMGFISVFGIAIQDSIIVVTHFQRLRNMHGQGIEEAARNASLERLRPALMTTLVACLGLLPAALSTRIGSQTQKPLAVVVIGGCLTIALLSRVLQPPLLVLFHRWYERRNSG